MFEDVSSFQNALKAETALSRAEIVPAGDVLGDATGGALGRAGDALRAIGWNELSARINAARDLRQEMRRDAAQGSMNVASFGDAAASYFAAIEEGERPVNPITLEGRKASAVLTVSDETDAARGDRETTDD